jgi:hypothetical protein
MTWHSLFDFSTMANRHLIAAYAVVLGIQAGYLGWVARNWMRAKGSRD